VTKKMSEREQWYTNKELFEHILTIRDDMKELSVEMKETRETIKKYNGLREKINELENEVIEIKAKTIGKSAVFRGIREWGGWVIAIISLLLTFYRTINM
jgi:uncharacterized protein YydD (DUF2326 family)